MSRELTFDFVTDEEFRISLQSDYAEMSKAMECGAWKAVHVLAGSVIEALLLEYLVVSKIKPNGKDPLKVDLGEAISACEAAKVLTPRTSSLCDVIRDYRNLIHPGRLIRLQDKYDGSSAQIAVALVGIITDEVAQKRRDNYGLTAEQIAKKILIDEAALAVIPNLLQGTSEYERRRLVERVIPESYSAQSADWMPDQRILANLKNCYRTSLATLPMKDQARVAERFARMVREESSEKIASYADAFFSCQDMQHLESNDRELVKKHILARVSETKVGEAHPSDLVELLKGLGTHLDETEIFAFVNMCVRYVLSGVEPSQKAFASLLESEYESLKSEEIKTKVENQIAAWLKMAREKNYSQDRIARLELLELACSDIPF